ncbi:Gag-Pol [Cucumis melo var. makuwa]|uniref:Gag-Pol n=1 Tax=Cucumis melo var. makuwa TaxID=1194695 RepID=A0A5D3E5G6_CUCMM|nr:Gag-Pol [Cucumis melo var. makuwa]
MLRKKLDVKIAFLYGDLEEEVHMLKPEGFGVKRTWFADPCVYFKMFGEKDFIVLLLYVDDMLVADLNKDRIEELKAHLARKFEMKDLGLATKILGMQIHQDRNNRKIWISSNMSPSSETERMEVSRIAYALVVGNLMFTLICARPYIALMAGVISRYVANPG